MNAIHQIEIYRSGKTWAFDDAARGIVREPFVAGMPEIIDGLVSKHAGRAVVTFSAAYFPGFHVVLRLCRSECGGNWYETESGSQGWLCPVLLKYFKKPPKTIFARVEKQKC